MPHPRYDLQAIQELSDRTTYEVWLLEAVYKLVNHELFPVYPDGVIYPLGGSRPVFHTHMGANILLGDWRPGFLAAGAPLVFISTFKFLDMFLEWVLERNGFVPDHRFSQKIQTLKGQITYPPVLQQRPWLHDRLRALYEALEPLRGTIIHSRHFESTNGDLRVSSSKRSTVGPEVQISAQALRSFAMLCISILHYVEGTWTLEPHREHMLRWQLDQLANLHLMPSLGQKEPYRTTVRMFIDGVDPCVVDVGNVRRALEVQYPNSSAVFDLRVLLVQSERVIAAFLFPWGVLDEVQKLKDPSPYSVTIPSDLDPVHYAQGRVV